MKLSERMREAAPTIATNLRFPGFVEEVATLERQLAEALAEPTYEEKRAAVKDTQRNGICASFIAARRKRIVGEGK